MLIDGEERRAGEGILRWRKAERSQHEEPEAVISREEEWSGQMESVHNRLRVPVFVGWGFCLSLCSYPCAWKSPSELHAADWSFSAKLTQCPLFWANLSSISDHLAPPPNRLASLLWSPSCCGKVCVFLPQWTVEIRVSPILQKGFGTRLRGAICLNIPFPSQREGPRRECWGLTGRTKIKIARRAHILTDFREHAPWGGGRNSLSARGFPGIILRQMWDILGQFTTSLTGHNA